MLNRRPSKLVFVLPLLALAVACGKSESDVDAAPAESSPTPVDARASVPHSLNPFPPQEGWIAEEVTKPMRMAQYRLPRVESDAEDAELVLFFFRGMAGGVEPNIARWIGMFEQEDGRSSEEVAVRTQHERDGLTFHGVDVSGRMTTRSDGQAADAANWRMLATIVVVGEDAYYVKLTGPSPTVAYWQESYSSFLDAIDPPR